MSLIEIVFQVDINNSNNLKIYIYNIKINIKIKNNSIYVESEQDVSCFIF